MMGTGRVLAFPITALLCLACSGYDLDTNREDTVRVDFIADNSSAMTKVSETQEDRINNIKLLVFDSDERLILYKSERSGSVKDVELPGKTKLFLYAVVNSPDDFSNVKCLDDFLARKSRLEDNTRKNLIMVGHLETALTKSGTVVIPVKRLVAQIQICSIETTVPDCSNVDDHWPEYFYLNNVSEDYPYSGGIAKASSYVSSRRESIEVGCENITVGTPGFIREDGTYYHLSNEEVKLFCYPNYLSERQTGLVIRFWGQRVDEVGYKQYVNTTCLHYLSIRLPILESNKLYRIPKLVINVDRYGSSDSDDSKYEITASCKMESFDICNGLLCESFNLTGEHYEEDFKYFQ